MKLFKNKTIKVITITAVVIGALAGALVYARYYINSHKKVGVITVNEYADTWSSSYSERGYGQISSGGIENYYLDKTMLLEKTYVKENDTVKKGDALFKYDDTQSKLMVEDYHIKYQMAQNNLNKAEDRLEDLDNVSLYSGIDTSSEVDKIADAVSGDGSENNPYVYNINNYSLIKKEFFDAINTNVGYFVFNVYYQMFMYEDILVAKIEGYTCEASSEPVVAEKKYTSCDFDLAEAFKTNLIDEKVWLSIDGLITPFDTSEVSCESPKNLANYELDYEQTLSPKEIKEMVENQQDVIDGLKIALAQAELDYRKAKNNSVDGIVRAESNGVVTYVSNTTNLTEEQEYMTVKSSMGYEVTTTINEYQLNKYKVGDTFTIQMWSTGNTYTATIKEISMYPSDYGYSYSDQASASSYEVLADLECEDELETWDGGEIQFASSESNVLFSLESCFVREENGRSYVLVCNENDRLEKRFIETGKITNYGYYVEIIDGLSLDDKIAFPYGKNAIEGAIVDHEMEAIQW